MKCGICGNKEPTWENRGVYGQQPATVLTVHDATDLVTHKRQQHPDEYKAGLQKRQDTRAANERAERDYLQRRGEAGLRTGQTVLYKQPYSEWALYIWHTMHISHYDHPEDYRYPDPQAFQEYEALRQEIHALEDRAALALVEAFEQGAPVPQEDVDRVREAMDAVPQ